jgi:peptidyl-prolyl cis-trans isomerase D
VQVSDKEIEDYYKTNLNTQFHRPKEIKVRYISIPIEPGADTVPKKTAQARAEAVVKAARSGKDFAQLAQKESSDATAAKGGDIGWITAGQMPPPMEKVLFGLAQGAVSDAIETPAGYQIFKVEDIREEKTLTLKEATPEITTKLKSEKAKREAVKVADRDREKALGGAEFSKLAQESGATLKTTSWITNGQVVPDIGENQEFYKNAFPLSAKDIGAIVEGKNAYYLLRLKQRQAPTVPPLASVTDQIEKSLKESKAYELALKRGNSLLEQLKKTRDIAKLAQANNLNLEDTGWFLRSAPQLPKIGELAEMKAGPIALTEQKPIPDRLYTQKDALYVIAFKASQGADMEQFEKEKELIKKQALAESRQRALVKFMEGLKSKAQIKVNTAFLEES